VTRPAGPPDRDRMRAEAVSRAELRRSRQAVFGTGPSPEAAAFAGRLVRAVADAPLPVEVVAAVRANALLDSATDQSPPPAEMPEPGRPRVHPALREAAFGAPSRPLGGSGRAGGPEVVPLPSTPALVCDRHDRIVRVNAAFLRLAGYDAADTAPRLFGRRLPQVVVGPDADARLVRADGGLVRVRVVRWDVPERDLLAVAVVELGDGAGIDPARPSDRGWTAELERMARVGTWVYDLSTATLTRSDTLQELYRSAGVDPESGAGPVEGEQVALLCRALRSGRGSRDSAVELPLPGGCLLSCRAEVEYAADGTPLRLVGVVRDVGAQRRAEGRVRFAGQRFADLMALSPSGVALLDPAGRVVDANPALCALIGVPLERLRGTAAADLLADPRPGELGEASPGQGAQVGQVALRRADGTSVRCEVAMTTTSGDDGGRFRLLVYTNVEERRRAAEVLRRAGTVDELTRLPNRAAALALLDRLLAGPGREGVAVVCGDLDDFHRINSSLGHDAGDDLLVAVAARLQRELPFGCTAARVSGDEFAVICADHAEVGGADRLARTVVDLLATTVTVHGRAVPLTASVGVATVPGCPDDGSRRPPLAPVRAADLLRFAEAALHEAKQRDARGAVAVATEGVVHAAVRALELEAQLHAAVAEDGLMLLYQPVVGPDGTVRSAEALVRWPHPERGLIGPPDFLPVAQRSGLLRELDLWVLRAATREAARWPDPDVSVAVNLAGLLPGDPDFLASVSDAVRDAGLPWHRLVLELVETSLVALPPAALAAMAELVGRGVRFAVDDFGTGYSSLARLTELPAQVVKVDRAFVAGIADDPAAFAVARAVVDMARAMGRATVAEGVETAEQFHLLRGIGVDAYQGWLFAPALPAGDLRELLAGDRLPVPPPTS